MSRQRTVRQIRQDQGEILHAYHDQQGMLRIGVGTLIDERAGGSITPAESMYLLINRLERIDVELDRRIPWWRSLDEARQGVLVNIAFALGVDRLFGLRRMLAHVQGGRYAQASVEMLSGVWESGEIDPARAYRLATQMRTNEWQFKFQLDDPMDDPTGPRTRRRT